MQIPEPQCQILGNLPESIFVNVLQWRDYCLFMQIIVYDVRHSSRKLIYVVCCETSWYIKLRLTREATQNFDFKTQRSRRYFKSFSKMLGNVLIFPMLHSSNGHISFVTLFIGIRYLANKLGLVRKLGMIIFGTHINMHQKWIGNDDTYSSMFLTILKATKMSVLKI